MMHNDLKSPKLNWQSGRIHLPLSHESETTDTWSVVICGDWAPAFSRRHAMPLDPTKLYGDLLPILQQTDLAIVNLECTLTDDDLTPITKDGNTMKMPSKTITALSAVPFHLACLANNHTFDYSVQGLTNTQELLKGHHIQSVGAGLCSKEAEAAKLFRFGNTRLAVVNVAEGEEARSVNSGPGVASLDLVRLRPQLASLQAQADVLLVVVHAGREFLPVPASYIRDTFRSLIDAGADIVIGHHPHVPQGIELYKGKPIAYSLGNFAFYLDTPARHQHLGYLLKADFFGSELGTLEIWPYRIEPNGLHSLKGEQSASFLAELEDLSALIVDDDRLTAVWDAYADRWLASLGIQDLVDSVAQLGGEALLIQAALKASSRRFTGSNLFQRLARRLIWKSVNLLDKRINFRRPAPRSVQMKHMKHSAAILRNRFDTLAHRELYLTALRRMMDGRFGQAPAWASQLLDDWQVFGMCEK